MPERKGKFFDGTHRTPLDPTAAMVAGPGLKHPPRLNAFRYYKGIETWALPMEMKTPPDNIINYTGHVKGKLTVIGYIGSKRISHGRKKNGKPRARRMHQWQVRCACGRYEIRSNIVIARKKTNHAADQCQLCLRQQSKSRLNALRYWAAL